MAEKSRNGSRNDDKTPVRAIDPSIMNAAFDFTDEINEEERERRRAKALADVKKAVSEWGIPQGIKEGRVVDKDKFYEAAARLNYDILKWGFGDNQSLNPFMVEALKDENLQVFEVVKKFASLDPKKYYAIMARQVNLIALPEGVADIIINVEVLKN